MLYNYVLNCVFWWGISCHPYLYFSRHNILSFLASRFSSSLCINQGSSRESEQKRDLLQGIGLCDHGGWLGKPEIHKTDCQEERWNSQAWEEFHFLGYKLHPTSTWGRQWGLWTTSLSDQFISFTSSSFLRFQILLAFRYYCRNLKSTSIPSIFCGDRYGNGQH